MRADARQRAQSVIEFALVLPLFLLLIFALIDFSRLLFSYISLVNGAREMARVAALPATTTSSPAAPVSAFNNLTLIGGPTNPATQVTLTPSPGHGSGSISCTALGAAGCALKLTTTKGISSITVTLSPQSGGSGTAAYVFTPVTATPDPSAFGASANGDFLIASTVGSDLNGSVRICPLTPTASCVVGASTTASDGFFHVDLTYTFSFSPLFQNRLSGIVDASFMQPVSTLRTSARTYVE